jgi:outer membrane protein TolC
MRLPTRARVYALRLLAGLVPVVALAVAGARDGAPVLPTVPAPVPRPFLAKGQMPLPAPTPLQDGAKNGNGNGNGDTGGPELTLGECIGVALERQPALKAVQQSAAAIEAGERALRKFGTVTTIFSPDLEIRKQQAKRGLMATSAEYQKLHNEVVQDVTRLFYTAVYAKQQQELAENVVTRLDFLVEVGKNILKDAKLAAKELEGFNTLKLRMMEDGLLQAKTLQATAKVGEKKALAGLREVMGVDARTFPFRVKDTQLPVMKQNLPLTADRVVELALERRPELVLAAAGVDAFRLEVYAQGRVPFKRVVPTLASGADIHAKEIPAPNRGTDYRPGAIIPEMPTQLVGSKYDRVCRAMAFAQRAESVYEKARNLVVAEAEGTFYDFELASEKLGLAKQRFELSKDLQKRIADNQDLKAKDQLLQAEVVAAKALSDYLTAVHEYLLALAALERVTAGGIRPEFPGR